jgi:hypothetical protein
MRERIWRSQQLAHDDVVVMLQNRIIKAVKTKKGIKPYP